MKLHPLPATSWKNIFFHQTIIDLAVFKQRDSGMTLYSSTYGRQPLRRQLNSGFSECRSEHPRVTHPTSNTSASRRHSSF